MLFKKILSQQQTGLVPAPNFLFVWGTNNADLDLFTNTNVSIAETTSPITVFDDKNYLILPKNNRDDSEGVQAVINANNELFIWGQDKNLNLDIFSSEVKEYSKFFGQERTLFALKPDGTLWTWGYNFFGNLGLNNTVHRSSPVQVGGSWTTLDSYDHTVAIRSDGTLWAWGQLGLVGDGFSIRRSSPVQISASIFWTKVSVSESHSLALQSDGGLYAWGIGASGRLGDGFSLSRLSPVKIGSSSWTQISAGFSHSLAIRSDGTLWAWGYNFQGQLGLDDRVHRSSPVQIGVETDWTHVQAGTASSFAIRNNSDLYGWGYNSYYNLGLNDTVHRSSPVLIGTDFSDSTIVKYPSVFGLAIVKPDGLYTTGTVTTEFSTTLKKISNLNFDTDENKVIMTDGAPSDVIFGVTEDLVNYQKGSFSDGLAIGSSSTVVKIYEFETFRTLYEFPEKIEGSWSQLSIGKNHALAIKSDGTLWGWGKNFYGQLGLGNFNDVLSPTQITTGSWTQVVASDFHSLALRDDKLLFGAGLNESYVLTDSVASNTSWKMIVSSISFEEASFLAIRSDDTLWAWGKNTYGELGINSRSTVRHPVQVGEDKWADVKISKQNSRQFCLGIKLDKAGNKESIWSWGDNSWGQLGLNDSNFRSSPTLLWINESSVITEPKLISVGGDHAGFTTTLVRTNTDTNKDDLYLFGRNVYGQLGQEDRVHRSSPVLIGRFSPISALDCGVDTTFYSAPSVGLFGAGYNFYGQLGDGTRISRSSLVQISTSSFNQISSHAYNTFGIRSDGTLWGWGFNGFGNLGQDDRVHRSSPVQVGTSSWTQVVTDSVQTLGIKEDSTLWHWGFYKVSDDIVGEGLSRSSPVQIGTSSWTMVSAFTDTYSTALNTNIQYQVRALIDSSGDLYYLGDEGGQPDETTFVSTTDPVQISLDNYVPTLTQLSSDSWNQISSTPKKVLAIKSDRTLWGWGDNRGLIIKPAENIHKIPFDKIKSQRISSGFSSGVGLKATANGKLYITNAFLPPESILLEPKRIDFDDFLEYDHTPYFSGDIVDFDFIGYSSTGVSYIGRVHVITSLGELWAVGENSNGQLGIGNPFDTSTWTQVPGSWSQISAGFLHTLAIRSDGTLWAWGYNTNGQLGLDDRVHRSSPVQIGSDSWTYVSSGILTSFAIKSDGTLWSWGYNFYGQLGLNDKVHRSSPVQIGSDSWTYVTSGGTGSESVFAIKSNGTLWSWGYNFDNLGNTPVIHRSSPVQVGTDSDWIDIAPGISHTIFLKSNNTIWGTGSRSSLFDVESGSSGSVNGYLNILPKLTSDVVIPTRLSDKSDVVLIGADSRGFHFTDSSNNFFHLAFERSQELFDQKEFFEYPNTRLNDYYVFRNPNLKTISSPVQIGSDTWKKISVTNNFAAGINKSNKIYTWGLNNKGNLGLSNYELKTEPSVVGSSSWLDLETGPDYVLAIDNKQNLYGWGENKYFTIASDIEKSVTHSWKLVSCSNDHVLAIRSDDTLWAWGNNDRGKLGTNNTVHRSSPVQIGSDSWIYVSAKGFNMSAAIRSDNTLWTWGSEEGPGVLGHSDNIHRSSPTQIPGSWIFVDVGYSFVAALDSDYKLWTWGGNLQGQLGLDDRVHRSSPVQVGTSSWTQISCGAYHMAGYTSSNNVFTWGLNTNGQLGQGDFVDRSSPTLVSTSNINYDLNSPNDLIVSEGMTGLITNTYNQLVVLGHANWLFRNAERNLLNPVPSLSLNPDRSSPVILKQPVKIISFSNVNDVAQGSFFVTSLGQLFSDGENFQISGTNGQSLDTWSQIGTFSYSQVQSGTSTVGALSTSGTLYMWGNNFYGQLGQNDRVHRSSPVSLGSGFLSYSMNAVHNCATKGFGSLWTWGRNTSGQLGHNNRTDLSSPVQVGTSNWLQASAGELHTVAIKNDFIVGGSLWSWGYNGYGQLGINNTFDRSSPVQISATSWLQVSAGSLNTLAIRADNTLWAWGYNTNGQLGQNHTFHRSSPVQIPGSWSLVKTASASVLGVKTDGTVWAWGSNLYGKFGLGDTNNRSSPTQISSFNYGTSWSYVKATNFNTHFKTDLGYSYFSGHADSIPTAFPRITSSYDADYPMIMLHSDDSNTWPNVVYSSTGFSGTSDVVNLVFKTNNNELYYKNAKFTRFVDIEPQPPYAYGTLITSNVSQVSVDSYQQGFTIKEDDYLYFFGTPDLFAGVAGLDDYWRIRGFERPASGILSPTIIGGLRSNTSIYYNSPILIGSTSDKWSDITTLEKSAFALKE